MVLCGWSRRAAEYCGRPPLGLPSATWADDTRDCVAVARFDLRPDHACPGPDGPSGAGDPRYAALSPAERSVSIYLVDAHDTQPQDLTPWQKILLAEYQEVCKSHSGITDFRAKLLALLPIASGAGVGLLVIQGQGEASGTGAGLLIGLGIFGAVVTMGLFLYELRQIDVCKQLRNHAAWIERQLGIKAGQFGGRRERLSLSNVYSPDAHRDRDKRLTALEETGQRPPRRELQPALPKKTFIGAETAGYLIYHSVIAAWLFVAALGVAELA
jgi:hypothetical protein